MTNARQVKEIFLPLLERHKDLVQNGARFLWIKPVHHLTLRVFIERTSHGDYAAPQWNLMETFLPNQNLIQGVGHSNILDRRESSSEKYWRWSDPTMIDDTIFAIENEALPLLRSMRNFETYAAYYYYLFKRSHFEDEENRMIVDISMGNLDAARETCEKLLPKYRDDKYPDWFQWQNLRTKVVTVAEPLLAADKVALARILHGWEAGNIRGTKIEPYWEPTPFPLEAGLG